MHSSQPVWPPSKFVFFEFLLTRRAIQGYCAIIRLFAQHVEACRVDPATEPAITASYPRLLEGAGRRPSSARSIAKKPKLGMDFLRSSHSFHGDCCIVLLQS